MNPRNFFGELKRRNVIRMAELFGWRKIADLKVISRTSNAPVAA
jgi:hypothetical protein